ncbi:1-aminocyclopropane-1-carboxylate synthase-like protein 1 [Protopterus annectens]|uniref:1-aminocyclopropane-1-carboxylate synthase-like protein 1 n=1 Tax=Protopterus annectens TaxID=7888 RepID=UPI001CFBE298|nr:1-aminocyclopropane-1-carboxylate synthase-like protein 1 [Protopterus annectens]XP_043925592.1 1-aminocyclopropane-1-carboxylate synthase-like protein 1 [Protopterus annectens]
MTQMATFCMTNMREEVMKLNKMTISNDTVNDLPCEVGIKGKQSYYLSNRGNAISSRHDIMATATLTSIRNKYDEHDNPYGIINIGISENKQCFDLLKERLIQKDMHHVEESHLQYADWRGHRFLREAFAKFLTYHCKASSPLKTENIVVLNGGGSLFCALSAVLCDPGDGLLIATPYYGAIITDISLYNNVRLFPAHTSSKIVKGTNRPFQLTVQTLEKGLRNAKLEGIKISALILMNPHNPLADIYSESEMTEFLEFAKRNELHVIVNEVYMLSVFDECETFHSVLSFDRIPDPQRTHVMWGLSKDFSASGLRVASVYSENQDVINALATLGFLHGLPGTIQYQVTQLLTDEDWINTVFLPTNRARLKEGHEYVTHILRELDIPFLNRHAALYLWADFRKFLKTCTFEEEIALWNRFIDNKVMIMCGKAFNCCEPGWFRIIFSETASKLELAMMRLKMVIKEVEQEIQAENGLCSCRQNVTGNLNSEESNGAD